MADYGCPSCQVESKKGLHTLVDKACLMTVVTCSLAGLAKHALYMRRLVPAKGHVLGLTGKLCQNGNILLLEHLVKVDGSYRVWDICTSQMCTPEQAL